MWVGAVRGPVRIPLATTLEQEHTRAWVTVIVGLRNDGPRDSHVVNNTTH